MTTMSKKYRQPVFVHLVNALPDVVRLNVMRDKEYCDTFGVRSKYWLPLSDELSVETDSLHKALREAVAGATSGTLSQRDGLPVQAALGLTEDGRATIVAKGQGFSFSNVRVFSKRRVDRVRALRMAFAACPLSPVEEEQWLTLAKERGFTDDEYADLSAAFGMTPDGLQREMQEAASLSIDLLMPDDPAYYARLIAPPDIAPTLPAYIEQTLGPKRQDEFRRHPMHALRRFGFSALWQPLIPFELLASVKRDDIERLLEATDPFSLLFGFELCCRSPRKRGVHELGGLFLDRLFGDHPDTLERCKVFSACSFLALSRVQRAARAERAPVYWSRFAALAHAGVLTNALFGKTDVDAFYNWMKERFLPDCFWHVTSERWDAPRWAPEWILPDHLLGELVGRAFGALASIPEQARPADWVAFLSELPDRLAERGQLQPTFLPGPFDDQRTEDLPRPPLFDEMEQVISQVKTLEDAKNLPLLVHATTPTPELVATVSRLVRLPSGNPSSDQSALMFGLLAAAHLAATARSVELCDTVTDRCLREAYPSSVPARAVELFSIMAIACAAHSQVDEFRVALGQAAARIGSVAAHSMDFAGLLSIFRTLAAADPKLGSYLARGRAIIQFRQREA